MSSDTPRTDEDAMAQNILWGTKQMDYVKADFARTLERELAEARAWKESAISVTPPLQEIGAALGIQWGDSIHDKILPGILALKDALEQVHDRLCKFTHETLTDAQREEINKIINVIKRNRERNFPQTT